MPGCRAQNLLARYRILVQNRIRTLTGRFGMRGVTSIADYRNTRTPEREAHLRRLAMQLAVQLPADTRDALDCLDMAKTAVRSFLAAVGPSGARFCHGCEYGGQFGVNHSPESVPVDIIRGDARDIAEPDRDVLRD